MRTLVIADIHGALRALKQVLSASGFKENEDQLIFLGDYVDGWSESAETIQFLIDLEKRCVNKPIFLMGNHDSWCKDWLNFGIAEAIWAVNGGATTIESYIATGMLTSQEHRDFFNKLHNYYVDDNNRGFVHGGFISRKGLGHEAYKSDYYWDRSLWDLALILESTGVMFDDEKMIERIQRFYKHKELYIGHTATENWKVKPTYREYKDPNQPKNGAIIVPMYRCNVWNLDTGCGFNGKLTIMDIDNKEYWQSDYTKDLYPNELGRN